jgi:ankyrin repeat protein
MTSKMMSTVISGTAQEFRLFLDQGMDIESRDRSTFKMTVLMNASLWGNLEVVRAALDHGCNIEAIDPYGRSALMLAATSGAIDVVRLLARRGANVNRRDTDGLTALMLASGNPLIDDDAISVLVEAGADIDLVDNSSLSALMHAVAASCCDHVSRLLSLGAKTDTTNSDGLRAIHIAFRPIDKVARRRMLEALLRSGEDPFGEMTNGMPFDDVLKSLGDEESRAVLNAFKVRKSLDGIFSEAQVPGEKSCSRPVSGLGRP